MFEFMGRASKLKEQFLTNDGIFFLGNDILFQLANALTDEDVDNISKKKVLFNVIPFPAAEVKSKTVISKQDSLITIELISIKRFSIEEAVAVILHELGHAFDSGKKSLEEREFIADDFAINRNRGVHLFNSIETSQKIWPENFNEPIFEKRKARIKAKLLQS